MNGEHSQPISVGVTNDPSPSRKGKKMPKFVGFIFGLIAGPLAAAWLYGGSTGGLTWGPGFAAKDTALQSGPATQFNLSSEPPAAKPTGEPAPVASATPPPKASDQSPPPSAETAAATPAFNTGGNPNVEIGASPNWALGYGVGRTGK